MHPSVAASNLLLMAALLLSGMNCFKICSYNVPKFNMDKSSNQRVIHTLTRVFARCDISLLLDVQHPAAVNTLLKALNRYSKKFTYKSLLSKPLGKDASNMQSYTFIYRQTVNATGELQHQSSSFVRPPMAVRFQSTKTSIPEFILVPLHSEYTKAVQEIDKLYDVFLEVVKKWNNHNVMFLGDFHASCAYVTRPDKKNIRLFSNTSFSWLISDRMDTTVTDETHCAYDRIVVFGKNFLKHIKPFSAKVFNPVQTFKMRSSQVVVVSDHFPIEVELKSSGTSLLQVWPLYLLLLILHIFYWTS